MEILRMKLMAGRSVQVQELLKERFQPGEGAEESMVKSTV